jgi:MFS family permease
MLIGRVVFGFGGESLAVANSAVLASWFKGKELAFAFGLNLSIARLGSVINNVVSPALASGVDIQFALWFGTILCGGSVAAVLAINTIDKSMEMILETKGGDRSGLLLNNENDEEVVVDIDPALTVGLTAEDKKAARSASNDRLIKANAAGSSMYEDLDDNEPPQRARIMSKEQGELAPVSDAKFSDVFKFKQIFWIMAAICVVVYGEYCSSCSSERRRKKTFAPFVVSLGYDLLFWLTCFCCVVLLLLFFCPYLSPLLQVACCLSTTSRPPCCWREITSRSRRTTASCSTTAPAKADTTCP